MTAELRELADLLRVLRAAGVSSYSRGPGGVLHLELREVMPMLNEEPPAPSVYPRLQEPTAPATGEGSPSAEQENQAEPTEVPATPSRVRSPRFGQYTPDDPLFYGIKS